MPDLEILTGREHVDPRLLMKSDPSLARVMGQLNLCTCFSGILDGENIVACLLNEQTGGDACEITNISVKEHAGEDIKYELVVRVAGYAREKGYRYLDIGIGNADIDSFLTLQKMGFRVTGVEPDHYQSDSRSLAVENGIVNRDMIRYRADFKDGWITWTKEVKTR